MTRRRVAGPAATAMAADVPAIEPVTVSVAVMVWLPTVTRVAGNVPAPLVRVALDGRVAAVSLLVKCTVPV